MYEPVQQCKHCGAKLTLDDLRAPNCRYCGVVLPHQAQAAQHAAVVGQVMNQMIAQAQAPWQPPGMGAVPPGPPGGAPPVGPPPGVPMGAPGYPYADPNQLAAAHMANANKLARNITLMVSLTIVGSLVLTGVIMWIAMAR